MEKLRSLYPCIGSAYSIKSVDDYKEKSSQEEYLSNICQEMEDERDREIWLEGSGDERFWSYTPNDIRLKWHNDLYKKCIDNVDLIRILWEHRNYECSFDIVIYALEQKKYGFFKYIIFQIPSFRELAFIHSLYYNDILYIDIAWRYYSTIEHFSCEPILPLLYSNMIYYYGDDAINFILQLDIPMISFNKIDPPWNEANAYQWVLQPLVNNNSLSVRYNRLLAIRESILEQKISLLPIYIISELRQLIKSYLLINI